MVAVSNVMIRLRFVQADNSVAPMASVTWAAPTLLTVPRECAMQRDTAASPVTLIPNAMLVWRVTRCWVSVFPVAAFLESAPKDGPAATALVPISNSTRTIADDVEWFVEAPML